MAKSAKKLVLITEKLGSSGLAMDKGLLSRGNGERNKR